MPPVILAAPATPGWTYASLPAVGAYDALPGFGTYDALAAGGGP